MVNWLIAWQFFRYRFALIAQGLFNVDFVFYFIFNAWCNDGVFFISLVGFKLAVKLLMRSAFLFRCDLFGGWNASELDVKLAVNRDELVVVAAWFVTLGKMKNVCSQWRYAKICWVCQMNAFNDINWVIVFIFIWIISTMLMTNGRRCLWLMESKSKPLRNRVFFCIFIHVCCIIYQ